MNVIICKSKRKTISISISNNGEVIVKAPLFVSDKDISNFVNLKKNWIIKHQNKINLINNEFDQIINKTKCLFFGEIVDFKPNFDEIITQNATTYLTARTHFLAQKFSFNFTKIIIKNYKSRWGACNTKKEITLNKKLICLNKELIDFVILHELCHTVHFNHQSNFHSLLNKILPNTKSLKNELNKYSFLNRINY